MTNPIHKGQSTTPDDPGQSIIMLWIRDVALPYQNDACLIWPFARSRDGYGNFGREGKNIKAHRYICTLVKGEPPTPDHHAAHSCGRGPDGCVSPIHLSWKTPAENFLEGQKHPRRKLTAEQVIEIRALKDLERVQDIAERFGVTECNIRKIQAGKLWRQDRRDHHVFTDDEVRAIRGLGRGAVTAEADRRGVSASVLYRIRRRVTFTHVPDDQPIPSTRRRNHEPRSLISTRK
jgi:hypothetical protein